MSSVDIRYYQRRAAAERALAGAANQDNVRQIHEEFARRYEALVDLAAVPPGKAGTAAA